jgi:hypothetical protein
MAKPLNRGPAEPTPGVPQQTRNPFREVTGPFQETGKKETMRGMTTSSFEQTPQTVEPVPFGSPARPQHERDAEIVSSAANTTHAQVSAQLSSRLDDVEKQVRSAMADKVKGKELSPEEQSRHRNGTEVAVMLERRKEEHGLDYNGNRIVQADGTLKPTHADIINSAVKETTNNELAKLAQGNDGGYMRKVKSLVEAGRVLAGTVGRMRGESGMGIRLRTSPGSALAQGVPTYAPRKTVDEAMKEFDTKRGVFDKDASGRLVNPDLMGLNQMERLHAAGQIHPDDAQLIRDKFDAIGERQQAEGTRRRQATAYQLQLEQNARALKFPRRYGPMPPPKPKPELTEEQKRAEREREREVAAKIAQEQTDENAAQGLVGPLPHPDVKVTGGDGKANRGKGGAAKPNQSLRDYERMVYGEDYKSPANKNSGRKPGRRK